MREAFVVSLNKIGVRSRRITFSRARLQVVNVAEDCRPCHKQRRLWHRSSQHLSFPPFAPLTLPARSLFEPFFLESEKICQHV